jgi:hypothetical protein
MPLSDRLVVVLVNDLPNSMQFVSENALDKWEVTLYQAFEVARQNLEQVPFKMLSAGDHLYALERFQASSHASVVFGFLS